MPPSDDEKRSNSWTSDQDYEDFRCKSVKVPMGSNPTVCLNSHSCLQKRASLTGKLLGCKISSCPCEGGAPVSKLATHSSATSLQTFHCLFYLTSVTSEDYLESGAAFICFLKAFILCFSTDTERKNWKLEGRKSEAAPVV